jgi:hypothetical protein
MNALIDNLELDGCALRRLQNDVVRPTISRRTSPSIGHRTTDITNVINPWRCPISLSIAIAPFL